MVAILFSLLLLVSPALISCDDNDGCNNEKMNDYLNCMDSTLNSNYLVYEDEFDTNLKTTSMSCFVSSETEPNPGNLCTFPLKPHIAANRTALIKMLTANCQLKICSKVADMIVGAYLASSEEQRQCAFEKLEAAMKVALQPCITQNYGDSIDFSQIDIPDYDRNAIAIKDYLLDNMVRRTALNFHVRKCSGEKLSASQQCLRQNPLTEHCSAIRTCMSNSWTSQSCNIRRIEQITCSCFGQERAKVSQNMETFLVEINKIRKLKLPRRAKMGRCYGQFVKYIFGKKNQRGVWQKTYAEIIDDCLLKDEATTGSLKVGSRAMAIFACRMGVSDRPKFMEAFETLLRLGQALMGSLIERIQRFCYEGANCSILSAA